MIVRKYALRDIKSFNTEMEGGEF